MSLFVVAFAVVTYPPHSTVDGNNVVLSLFRIKSLLPEEQELWKKLMTSNRTIITASDNTYTFSYVPEGYSIAIVADSEPNFFKILESGEDLFNNSLQTLEFTRQGDNFEFKHHANVVAFNDKYLVGGTYFKDYNYPNLGFEYVLNYPGTLVIVDDLGSAGGSDSILDWLSSFWDKFIEMLKSIFIPSPDYFQNFFNEIKTAFENKLGGIGELLGAVSNMFDSLKNVDSESSLTISIPDNQFYNGYKGLEVDAFQHIKPLMFYVRGILNSILVVFTVVICYKKIVSIIKT